jgi:hypothetical protein
MKTSTLLCFLAAIAPAYAGCAHDATVPCGISVEQGSESHLSFAANAGMKPGAASEVTDIVAVTLTAGQPTPTAASTTACLEIELLSGTILADCPTEPRVYMLRDLHACFAPASADGSATQECSPIDGVIVVRSFSLPCDDRACGRLDAGLRVDPNATAAAPALGGTATLVYRESQDVCANDSSGGGGNPFSVPQTGNFWRGE